MKNHLLAGLVTAGIVSGVLGAIWIANNFPMLLLIIPLGLLYTFVFVMLDECLDD